MIVIPEIAVGMSRLCELVSSTTASTIKKDDTPIPTMDMKNVMKHFHSQPGGRQSGTQMA